mgnify:FL=1
MTTDGHSEHAGRTAPRVVSPTAQAAFEAEARRLGLDPASRWVGGYVEHQWNHLRPIVESYGLALAGAPTLEFGANVGASAIVLAHLGAAVRGVDVDRGLVALARANARRFGFDDLVFEHVADTRRLPFADATFAVINCSSTLEYVEPGHLAAVQRELVRVLAPGGTLLVTGTSSRLWPREVHSRAWFVNYLPRALAPALPRGVWPWTVRRGFGSALVNLDALDGGRAFLAARAQRVPRRDGPALRVLVGLARALGVGPGMLAPNLSCVLRKPG